MSTSFWDILPNTIERPNLQDDLFWNAHASKHPDANVHIAILSRPYLDLLLSSAKTVESRFSSDKRAPYNKVHPSDVLLLKEVGGPICGIALVTKVFYYQHITPQLFGAIKTNFCQGLQINDPMLWERYKKASYATLIRVDKVQRIEPIEYLKRDQRAWITFDRQQLQLTL